MKTALLFVAVALGSGWVGYRMNERSPGPDAAATDAVKRKLESIGQADFEEYLRLKDQKERYEKADEILGKIMMLMIYDLGLRQSEGQLAKLGEQRKERSAVKTVLPPAAAPAAPEPAVNIARPAKKPAAKHLEIHPDWREKTAEVKDIYRADQVDDFLKSVQLPDLFGQLRGAKPLSGDQFEMLNGTFGGRALFDDPKDPPWAVSMSVNSRPDESGTYVGDFDIQLSKNGKQFSRTRARSKSGQAKPIKTDKFMGIDGDDSGIIVNVQGDDGYFQLYYFPRLGEFHGLVYLKKSVGVFERKGVVHLTKR